MKQTHKNFNKIQKNKRIKDEFAFPFSSRSNRAFLFSNYLILFVCLPLLSEFKARAHTRRALKGTFGMPAFDCLGGKIYKLITHANYTAQVI